jgi:sulfate permease, SulP family
MVVNGSLSKTAVNGGAAARSEVSDLVVAGLTVIALLFLTGLFENLPEATLAAVVIAAGIDLVDVPALARLYRVWSGRLGGIYGWAARADFLAALAALAALLGVLVFDTLPGLSIGIGVSCPTRLPGFDRPRHYPGRLGAAQDSSLPMWVDSDRHPDVPPLPGVLVVRVESGLFFANAVHVRDTVRSRLADDTRVVVLDAETSPTIDVTATEMLVQLAQDVQRNGAEPRVPHGIGQTRDVLRRAGQDTGVLHTIYRSVDDALAGIGGGAEPRDA